MSDTEKYVAEYSDADDEVVNAPEAPVKPEEVIEQEAEIDAVYAGEEEPKEPTPEPETPTVEPHTQLESKAREQGWVPLNEWKGDPAEWRDADVFLERGVYFKTMKDQKSEIEYLKEKVEKMAEFNRESRKLEREKVMKELREQKKEALELADYDQVLDIDEQIALETTKAAQEALDDVPPIENPKKDPARPALSEAEWNAWHGQNQWYGTNEAKTLLADYYGEQYLKENPTANPLDVLRYATTKVEGQLGGTPPSPVDSASNRGSAPQSGPKKRTPADLSEMQLDIGKTYVADGAVKNLQEYVDMLDEIGGLD